MTSPRSEEKDSISSNVAFLIEGFTVGKNTRGFPEVASALQLAEANQCEYFDSVSSFDIEHITTLLKTKTESEQQAIALCIYLFFKPVKNSVDIINFLIREPFKNMATTGIIKTVPRWVEELSPFTIGLFATRVLDKIFKNKLKKLKEFNKKFGNEALIISNEISLRRFLDYVNNRPKLTTIYGLVGATHLDMLDHVGVRSTKEGNYKVVRIPIKDRSVEVHLFGGIHGDMTHYNLLARHAEERGLIMPLPYEQIMATSEKLIESLLRTLSDGSSSPSHRFNMFESSEEKSDSREPRSQTTKKIGF